jgi:hypothetical protein
MTGRKRCPEWLPRHPPYANPQSNKLRGVGTHRLLPGSLKVEFTRAGSPRPGFFVVGGSHVFNLNVPMGLHQDLPNGAIEGLRGGRFDSLQ